LAVQHEYQRRKDAGAYDDAKDVEQVLAPVNANDARTVRHVSSNR